jgi:hemerythrin-like domain-containing protein
MDYSALEAHIRSLETHADKTHSAIVDVSCRATSGETIMMRGRHNRKPYARHFKGRSAEENLEIYRDQARKGRNPVFISAREQKKLKKLWADAIERHIQGNTEALMHVAVKVGEALIKAIRRHIDEGEAARGAIRKLTPGYARWKEYNFGREPILKRTGQLYESLYAKVRRVK